MIPLQELEMMPEAASGIPMWLNVAIGIATALGGWEAIKYLLSLRHHRKKDQAEAQKEEALANQEESHAKQEDTDWRQKELDLMTSFVNTAKEQYEDLTKRYDELKAERTECRRDKAEMLSAIKAFEMKEEERDRKMEGLQRAFTEEVAKRKATERLYCSIESCAKRKPPVGTYSADAPAKRGRKPKAATATA